MIGRHRSSKPTYKVTVKLDRLRYLSMVLEVVAVPAAYEARVSHIRFRRPL